MRSLIRGGTTALALAFLFTSSLHGRVAAPSPVPERFARAEVVVTGKVTTIEAKTVETTDGEFAIALVKIDDSIKAADGLTHIKVGFHPGGNQRFPHMSLKVGQEACFFLAKVPGQNFYTARMYFDIVNKDNETFAKDIAVAKKWGKTLAKPEAGLTSKDAGERFATAAILIKQYRNPTGQKGTAPVDAAQSKLILDVLAEADFNKVDPELRTDALQIFMQLGLTEKDGYMQPKDFQQIAAAAQKWCKENAGTYRIQRFVAEEPKK